MHMTIGTLTARVVAAEVLVAVVVAAALVVEVVSLRLPCR
jgi:hypothetical protein